MKQFNTKKSIVAKSIAKFVIAVALTAAVMTSSGVVAEQIGLDIVESVYAGETCSSGAGGGC